MRAGPAAVKAAACSVPFLTAHRFSGPYRPPCVLRALGTRSSGLRVGRGAAGSLCLLASNHQTQGRHYASCRAARCAAPAAAASWRGGEEEEDDDGDDWAAYENLLLNAEESPGDTDLSPGGESSNQDANPVEAALALLPVDGRAMRLTELTPSLDVEAISETYGSVLQMLQHHSRLFICTQARDGGTTGPLRWHVARREGPSASSTLPGSGEGATDAGSLATRAFTAADMTDLLLDEELRAAGLAAATTASSTSLSCRTPSGARLGKPRRLLQSSVREGSIEGTVATRDVVTDWASVAAALPAQGTVRLTAVRDTLLPSTVRASMRARGKGLLRLHHEEFHEAEAAGVEVSMDGVYMARRGQLADAGITSWSPAAALVATRVRDATSAKEEEGWTGSLDLDEDDTAAMADSGASLNPEEDDDDGDALLPAEAVEVMYDGLPDGGGPVAPRFFRPPRPDEVRRRPRQKASANPPAPRRTTSPPPSPAKKASTAPEAQKKRKQTPPPASSTPAQPKRNTKTATPRTPEELMAAHTQLAEQKGLRTPAEMLDLFVECVPTFFVPVDKLTTSDSLAKVLGPRNSMRQVVRVYAYFFERDRATDRVRLRPGLAHPLAGKANRHYAALEPFVSDDASPAAVSTDSSGFAAVAAGLAAGGLGPSEGSARPTSGSHLRSSATTRAFPVMRAVIKSDLDVGRGGMRRANKESTGHGPTSTSVSGKNGGGHDGSPATRTVAPVLSAKVENPFSLLSSPASTIPPPVRAFFALLTRLSHVEATPLRDVAALLATLLGPAVDTDTVAHALLQLADANTARSEANVALADLMTWIQRYELLLFNAQDSSTEGVVTWWVRLRPYWLAPGATGILGADALPPECLACLRPVWRPVSVLLETPAQGGKLSADARAALQRAALPPGFTGDEAAVRAATAAYLRQCGQCVWVKGGAAGRVRRFTATADLDDLSHACVPCVAAAASPMDWSPVPDVIAAAEVALRNVACGEGFPNAPARDAPEAGGGSNSGGVTGMLRADIDRTTAMLRRHPKELEVRVVDGQTLIRRKTRFAPFGTGKA